ncbi:hypothetical protein [Azospirillum canadense]|uniref:hypothetical protein n=1 Tax=Azospirillum canadense TaxID=403962 RepID=UPI0022267239|nr:hypothetical protein [Azospirillum canadense]MCW2243617.1 hypothetical protein [Azospirillum canadense]
MARDIPITCSVSMVRALLDGPKTQTRRSTLSIHVGNRANADLCKEANQVNRHSMVDPASHYAPKMRLSVHTAVVGSLKHSPRITETRDFVSYGHTRGSASWNTTVIFSRRIPEENQHMAFFDTAVVGTDFRCVFRFTGKQTALWCSLKNIWYFIRDVDHRPSVTPFVSLYLVAAPHGIRMAFCGSAEHSEDEACADPEGQAYVPKVEGGKRARINTCGYPVSNSHRRLGLGRALETQVTFGAVTKTGPQGWGGNEATGAEPLDTIYRDGLMQPLLERCAKHDASSVFSADSGGSALTGEFMSFSAVSPFSHSMNLALPNQNFVEHFSGSSSIVPVQTNQRPGSVLNIHALFPIKNAPGISIIISSYDETKPPTCRHACTSQRSTASKPNLTPKATLECDLALIIVNSAEVGSNAHPT